VRDITALITRRLQLQPRAVMVTLNQLEPYLVRFEKAADAARARDLGGS
jgi:phenylpyruvate tautomerase PptA (4-oxalocrotonate tautomerase family)